MGRHGGGARRLRYAVEQLREVKAEGLNPPAEPKTWDGYDVTMLASTRTWLQSRNVFYSAELDLDMMMLQAFSSVYGVIADVDATTVVANSFGETVFGKSGPGIAAYTAGAAPTDLQQAQYASLFKGGSKPVSHVDALSRLDDATIKAGAPAPLRALFVRCGELLTPETA